MGEKTHASGATATATTATTSAATSAATTRGSAARALRAGALSVSTLSLLTSRLGLASQLNGNLSLEDLLAGKLSNGTISLVRGRKVDKSVSDRAVGTRVLGDRDRLAAMVGRQQML